MSLWQTVKKEFIHGSIIFIFFFCTLGIFSLTERLLVSQFAMEFSFIELFVSAALITKIILVLDHFSLAPFLAPRPLILPVLWKTIAYGAITFLVRQSIRFFSYFHTSGWSLSLGWENYSEQFDLNLVIAVYSWYLMLLFVFISAGELTLIIGPNRMREIFFGKKGN